MNMTKKKFRIKSVCMTLAVLFAMLTCFPLVNAYAADSNVYTCTINRCYAHPVTGKIEDSGGEASYATGQGMVEGCVYGTGILELAADGGYYLTIRMSLMDLTSRHTFQVQNVGDSGWSSVSEIGVTGNGTDSNGSTADVCMRVPSENCVVRVSMNVSAMGRDVIFYLYPSDYTNGNNTDMKATMAAETSEASSSEQYNTASVPSADNTDAQRSGTASTGNTDTQSTGSASAGTGSLNSGTASLKNSGQTENKGETDASQKTLQSEITEAAAPSSDGSSSADTESSTLNSAEGLSLSTAEETEEADNTSSGNRIFQISLAVVICGLIFIGTIAGIIYLFHRNWRRWGGADDDEE